MRAREIIKAASPSISPLWRIFLRKLCRNVVTMHKITPLLASIFFTSAAALHIAITGTSQGIGLDAAKRLIRDGHTVYHANRNSARSAEAAQAAGGGIPMVCDLASLASVRQFADELSGKELDVLCLNAGIAPSTKAEAPETTAEASRVV